MFSYGKCVSSHPALCLSIADSLQKRQMSTKTHNHSSYLFLTQKPFYTVPFSGIMEKTYQDLTGTREARTFRHARARESGDYSELLTNHLPHALPILPRWCRTLIAHLPFLPIPANAERLPIVVAAQPGWSRIGTPVA